MGDSESTGQGERTIRSAGSDLKWFLGILLALAAMAYLVIDETAADTARETTQTSGIETNKQTISTHIAEWKEYRKEQKEEAKERNRAADERTDKILDAIKKSGESQ